MVQTIIDSLATAAARIEVSSYPSATILPRFPRSIQLDYYSCGAKSVYTVLRYFKKSCTTKSVERELNTDYEGTAISDMKRVFKRFRLDCRSLRKPGLNDLKCPITEGCPVLISTWDHEHYCVVFGYSRDHIFVANPSLDISPEGVGALWCAVPKRRFLRMWDRDGLVISRPQ